MKVIGLLFNKLLIRINYNCNNKIKDNNLNKVIDNRN